MKASIVILTFNAADYIDEVLTACDQQKTAFPYETIVIDSGSKDETLAIVARHQGVRLHQIKNTEFGHGKTRNLAAAIAKGEVVVYITHDATPANDYWLQEMVRPFDIGPDVACVLGNQIPRADCCPTVKRDVSKLFASLGPKHSITLSQKTDHKTKRPELDALGFYSDTNSAARKSVLQKIPYHDINYAEDQAFGKDVIAAGLYKAYNPLAAVNHSHNYPPKMYFMRMYDEMIGLKNSTGQTLNTSLIRHFLIFTKATLADWRFTVRDEDYSLGAKAKWLLQIPLYNFYRRFAIYLAARKQLPSWVNGYFSLETKLKKT